MGVWIPFGSISNYFSAIFRPLGLHQNQHKSWVQISLFLMSKYCKHILHVVALFSTIVLVQYVSYRQQDKHRQPVQPSDEKLSTVAIISTIVQFMIIILPLPQIICSILGLVLFDAFPGDIHMNKLKAEPVANGHAANGATVVGAIETTSMLNISTISTPALSSLPPLLEPTASPVSQQSPPPPAPPPSVPSKGHDLPHICFRVVTRGSYPELVQDNARKNFLTCVNAGLSNFSIEIVTDKDIQLMSFDQRVKQLIVPLDYRTSTGAMFKARALQYALEPGISTVSDNDYVAHLDEETIITNNVVNGIVNFALEGKHDFGQGLITYANLEVVNLFTTLADSYRVADDMGKVRFTLGALHKPIFAWKGSFVVTRCGAEKDVSFDHGPDGSIAEDCYFSMIAFKKGYTFDFIQGEMYEKSPFTLLDLIRQRKRWVQGIWLVVHSSKIPLRTKFFLAMSHYAWLTLPITSIGYVLMSVFTLPTHAWLPPIGSFCFSVTLYMYIFGLVKSFDLKKGPSSMLPYSILLVCIFVQVMTLTLNMVVENIAVIWGLLSPKHKFYIVKKELDSRTIPDV